ncbi:MAG: hypothetical protein ACYC37_02070 [Desulfobacteria bacterium]
MRAEVEAAYPDLRFSIQDECVFIHGSFPIKEDGAALDRYSIEVRVPQDFPIELPVLCEVGGRIPWVPDRHVNWKNGTACLFFPDERWRFFPDGATLRDFLEGPVRNFLISQSVFERTGQWPFGERGHGEAGILEAYGEMLEIPPDRNTVIAFLGLLSRREVKGHWQCPCGSGKILRKCHGEKVLRLRDKIGPENAGRSLKVLKNVTQLNSQTHAVLTAKR